MCANIRSLPYPISRFVFTSPQLIALYKLWHFIYLSIFNKISVGAIGAIVVVPGRINTLFIFNYIDIKVMLSNQMRSYVRWPMSE